jgi:mRNA-degrading endonuclease YafQ of YafQ-DinJ toxin-antitoxin module
MTASFRVLTTPSFDRDFRKIAKSNPTLESVLHELAAILGQDPYNRSARHPIKKLTDIKSDGQ